LILFIEDKVGKLDQYYDHVIGAEITLRLDKSDVKENKVVEIKLEIPGNDLFSKKQAKSFEQAIDQSVESIRRQLKKVKEKQRGL